MHFLGKIPGALSLMKPMFPVLFPRLLPLMLPKVMSTMLRRVEEQIEMPASHAQGHGPTPAAHDLRCDADHHPADDRLSAREEEVVSYGTGS